MWLKLFEVSDKKRKGLVGEEEASLVLCRQKSGEHVNEIANRLVSYTTHKHYSLVKSNEEFSWAVGHLDIFDDDWTYDSCGQLIYRDVNCIKTISSS